MQTKTTMVYVIMTCIIGFLLWGTTFAYADESIPALPAAYYGTVEDVDGRPVANGTVEAWVSGEKVDSIDIDNGVYGGSGGFDPKLLVSAEQGQTVEIKVDGKTVTTMQFTPGEIKEINLTLTADSTGNGSDAPGSDGDSAAGPGNQPGNDGSGDDIPGNGTTPGDENETPGNGTDSDTETGDGGSTPVDETTSGGDNEGDAPVNDTQSGGGATSSGGGGGGGPALTSGEQELKPDEFDRQIKQSLTKGISSAQIQAREQNDGSFGAVVSGSIMRELQQQGAALKIAAGEKVVFNVPPGALTVDNQSIVQFTLRAVEQSAARGILAGAARQGLSHIPGYMFELEAGAVNSRAGTPRKEVQVSINLAGMDLTGVDREKLNVYQILADGEVKYMGCFDPEQKNITFDLPAAGGTFAVMESKKTFADIEEHWARRDIEIMAGRQIAAGVTATEFAPGAKVTKGQFAALALRVIQKPEVKPSAPTFIDVPAGSWYYGAIEGAYAAGLVKGAGQKRFNPDAPITRQEMAAILARILPENDAPSTDSAPGFNDGSDIAGWAQGAVQKCVAQGVMGGKPGGNFDPLADATRAEAIVVLKRLAGKLN